MRIEAHWHDKEKKTMIVNAWEGPPADGNKYGSGKCYGVSFVMEDKVINTALDMLCETLLKKEIGVTKQDMLLAIGDVLDNG